MIVRSESVELLKQAKNHAVSILTGSRQVGKSTLMRMLRDDLALASEYYDLENPRHLALFDEGYTSFMRQNRGKLVFIDEFQYCKNISSVFKAVYDLAPEIKIYASGSSSLEIQAHLKESLAGRKLERVIYPLSFSEWLTQFRPALPPVPAAGTAAPVDEEEEYRRRLDDFLLFGAMPGLTHLESEIEKREYLAGIYQTYIAKDIKSFLKDESVPAFNKMISYLALNNGGQLNKNTLATISGVSSRQIDRHIEVLAGTYVISLVRPLSRNKGKELVKTPKFYFYDQGVLNAIIQDFRPARLRADQGAIKEQFAYWELKKSIDIRHSLYYWRTTSGNEVDFVLEKDRVYLPIEVKSSWPSGKTPAGIRHFFDYYPETRVAVVLYDGPEVSRTEDGRRLFFVPLYKACRIPGLL
jgi:predicted AAA+ superfamily ATPase